MLFDDALVCGDNGGNGEGVYSCNDDDIYDGNACNEHAHDNNHEYDALEDAAGGVHHDGEVTEVGVAG